MREQLVAVEPADHREDCRDRRVGPRRVKVGNPRRDRGRVEVVPLVHVRTVGEAQPESSEALVDDRPVVMLEDQRTATRRGNDTHRVPRAKLARKVAGIAHRPIVAYPAMSRAAIAGACGSLLDALRITPIPAPLPGAGDDGNRSDTGTWG